MVTYFHLHWMLQIHQMVSEMHVLYINLNQSELSFSTTADNKFEAAM